MLVNAPKILESRRFIIPQMRAFLYPIRLKRDDLGTPQTPAEGWPPSALLLIFITLQPDWISLRAPAVLTKSGVVVFVAGFQTRHKHNNSCGDDFYVALCPG